MPYVISVDHAPSRFRCCNCLHVRTGTLVVAIFQIIVHFIVVAILIASLGRASKFRDEVEYVALSISVMSFIQWERFTSEPYRYIPNQAIRTNAIGSLAFEPNSIPYTYTEPYSRTPRRSMTTTEEYVAIGLTFVSLLFSIMMLVGTICAKPRYLFPYIFMQFVDLFITCLSVVGYFAYLPGGGSWVGRKVAVSLLVISAGILLLALKTYLLAIVWLCYKFLLRYVEGRERSSGFSLVYGSRMFPATLCERWSCIQVIRPSSPVHATVGDQRPLSERSAPRPLSRNGIFVLLGEPDPRPTASGRLSSVANCLPPKYEDVLAMPPGAYDPPPYDEIAESQANRLPAADQPLRNAASCSTEELNNGRTDSGSLKPVRPSTAPSPGHSD